MKISLLAPLVALALLIAGQAAAEGALDYQNITARDQLTDMVKALRDGNASDRRIAADDIKEFINKYAKVLNTDPEAPKMLELAGAGLIELIHHGKGTTRVRSERILAEAVDLLGADLKGADLARSALAKELLEKLHAALLEHPDHPSGSKIIADIDEEFAAAGMSITSTTPADMDGMIEHTPGEAEFEQTTDDKEEQTPETVLQETPAAETVEDRPSASAASADAPAAKAAPGEAAQEQDQEQKDESAAAEAGQEEYVSGRDQQDLLPTELPVTVVTAPPVAAAGSAEAPSGAAATAAAGAGSAATAGVGVAVKVVKAPNVARAKDSSTSPPARKAPTVVSGPVKSSPADTVKTVRAPTAARAGVEKKELSRSSGAPAVERSTISPVITMVLEQLSATDANTLIGGLKLAQKSSDSFLSWHENQTTDTRINKMMAVARDLLRHGNAGVRAEAARTCAVYDDKLAVYPLIDLLSDSDAAVAVAAHDALIKIAGEDLGKDPAKWKAWADGGQNRD